ncbi:MAG TPA: 2-oxoacid:acceptor oxidoreductase family protein [Clostridia bacterium]|nr:2-oxoacid:acceptor oxidoreductase family protein [Clostridia bacterium]
MKSEKIFQVRLGGFGGQGVVLASKILGDALSREGYNVLQTQSYGIEARGGATCGEVLYGNCEINYLRVVAPDILLALNQDALNEYVKDVPQGGFVIYDDSNMEVPFANNNLQVFGAPLTDIAIKEMGNKMYLNIIALGFINGITKMTSLENLEGAIEKHFGTKIGNNLIALHRGYQEAGKLLQNV